MTTKLRKSILNAMWIDLGRIGLKRSDFTGHLRQTGHESECRCVVWFRHKTEYDEICTIVDHETLSEGIPIYYVVVYPMVEYFHPKTADDWDFPISSHDQPKITTENFVNESQECS